MKVIKDNFFSPDGTLLLINKPLGWTSFDAVKKVKAIFLNRKSEIVNRKLKVGHAGTLDPLATGLLVLCSGKLTQQISTIQDAEKEYTGTLVLGSISDSFDLETTPRHFSSIDQTTEEKILTQASSFCGFQMQTPPLFSAIK